jgi:hypothetical protein
MDIREQIAPPAVTAIRAVILTAATDRQEARIFLAEAARDSPCLMSSRAQAACLAVLGCYFPATAEAAESRDPPQRTSRRCARMSNISLVMQPALSQTLAGE